MLALSLIVGCAHLPSVGSSGGVGAPDSAVIGWRLVPGQELHYQHTVRLLRGDAEIARTESWAYLVREVSPTGEVLLEGRLSGLGALVREERRLLNAKSLSGVEEQERVRLGEQTVWVKLSTDGDVISVSGLSWEDSLPHRSLGLAFPRDSVEVGMSWPNPDSVSPYRSLVPPEVPISPRAEIQLVSFLVEGEGVYASLEFQGHIRAGGQDLPHIETQGEVLWDLVAGQLYQKSQRVSLSQYQEAFGGLLLIETKRQPQ